MLKLIIMTLILPLSLLADLTTEQSVGKAYDDDGKLRYTEKHTTKFKNGRIHSLSTKYVKEGGDVFGTLTSDFANYVELPDYQFVDTRFDRQDGSSFNSEDKSFTIYGKANKSADKKKKKVFIKDKRLISGQGLHAYIVSNMDDLMKLEKPFEFYFLIPMIQDFFSFRMKPYKKWEDKKQVQFRIEIDNWFLRLFAPHVDVTYNYETKRLLEYKGISNLLDDDEDTYDVTIKYSYNDQT